MSCGAPGMCGHRRDCPDKHCPGRRMEPPDINDVNWGLQSLLSVMGVIVVAIVTMLVFCAVGLLVTLWRFLQ